MIFQNNINTDTVIEKFYETLIQNKINNIRRDTHIKPDAKMDLHQTECYPDNEYYYDGNISDIISKLIQDCGRFTERYNSDLFITLQSMHKELEHRKQPIDKPMVYIYAMRESGVDSNSFMVCRLNEYKDNPAALEGYYRRIYAVYLIPEQEIQSCTRPQLFVYMDNYSGSMYSLKRILNETYKKLETNTETDNTDTK